MGLFDSVFSDSAASDNGSRQLPDNLVHEAFGEVNIRPVGDQLEVTFTILMQPVRREGWQTGVALDASSSMRSHFGRSVNPKSIPHSTIEQLHREGAIDMLTRDGQRVPRLTTAALQRIRELGVDIKMTKNVVEPIAREFITYLASELDEDGGTTVVYWACGANGAEYEVVGDFTADQCRTLRLAGPTNKPFGNGTRLTPVARYFVDRFPDALEGMYVFITDGRLDDMNELMQYTTQLARRIAAGERNPVKFVLIGVGPHVDIPQMEQLDDLDTGTDVDIWDHKIAEEMRNILTIFAEVVDETMVVAPRASIEVSGGREVASFTDGLSAKVTFRMPDQEPWFELVIGDQRLRQVVQFSDEERRNR